jgi:arylsulfatase A-like enzyme
MKPLVLLTALFAVLCHQGFAVESRKPNIVVIVADDLGYADVLFNPQHPKEVTTPHLDALARESIICRQGYVSGHVCAPTRAGLMTGRYQQRMGFYTAGPLGAGMPMSEKIFPQHFKPAGYATAQFGKWHLGPTPEWSPALRGFDEVFGFLGRGAHDYFKLDDPNDPIYRGTTVVHEKGYLTDRLGEETCAFISKQKDQPFLVYLAFNAVHAPLQAPADEVAKFNAGSTERNTLLAMGKRMDDAIGKVVATLKKEGVWENTLLFFISDNGGPLAQTADNTPLRGGKHQDYEGGIRVPFLVCWPGKLKPGESQAVVSSLDILPTALAAVGLPAPVEKPLDGINLLPILRGETPALSRNFFWSSGSEEGWWAVRSGDWKLVGEKARVSLFDLGKDIAEKTDLAAQLPEKVAELTKLHDAWLAEMPEPIQAGAKRFGMTPPAGASSKKPKSERKKNKGAPPLQTPGTAEVRGAVRESFATLPGKPWKTQRGHWEAKDGALWASLNSENKDAMLRGPAVFRSGTLRCELKLAADTRLMLRLRTADGEMLLRTDLAPDGIIISDVTGEKNRVLKKVPLHAAPDAWHTLALKFDGIMLDGLFDDAPIAATDAIFEREKAEVNFVLTAGTAGFRNFSVTPAEATK